jgi:hypothetical protein
MTPIGTLFTFALFAAAPMVPASGAATLSVSYGEGEPLQARFRHGGG